MFLNLCFLRDASFRDHNFSDFWNRGGGDSIERVSHDRIRRYLAESYLPDPLRSGHALGFPPDFDPIIPITLSPASCFSFIRSNPSLPITSRDYFLSKLFQFIYGTLLVRFQLEEPQLEVSTRLHELFDRIPAEFLPPDERINWVDFWWDFYADSVTLDQSQMLDRLERRLTYAMAPATPEKRQPGPPPQPDIYRLVSRVVRNIEIAGRTWKDDLSSTCTELDKAKVPISAKWQGANVHSWSQMLKRSDGKYKVIHAIEYRLKQARKYLHDIL